IRVEIHDFTRVGAVPLITGTHHLDLNVRDSTFYEVTLRLTAHTMHVRLPLRELPRVVPALSPVSMTEHDGGPLLRASGDHGCTVLFSFHASIISHQAAAVKSFLRRRATVRAEQPTCLAMSASVMFKS